MRKYSGNSKGAALASWAAFNQGKFWEMHDLLFDRAPILDRPVLDDLARDLGLDMGRFRKVMDEQARQAEGKEKGKDVPLSEIPNLAELQKNLDRVHELDIWSTPTVIINGRIIKGAQPYERYKAVIDEALGEGMSTPPSVTAAALVLRSLFPSEALAAEGGFGEGEVPLYIKVPRARPTNEPKVGEEAPDFTLTGVDDVQITLSQFRDKKNVLLTFMPAAFTPV